MINHKLQFNDHQSQSSLNTNYYSIITRSNGVNFQGIMLILMSRSIAFSFYSQQNDIWEGLTVRHAQKRSQIKLINICNISQYLSSYCNISQYVFGAAIPSPIDYATL